MTPFAAVFADLRARLARLVEALADGEYELAALIAQDLEDDLTASLTTLGEAA